MSGGNPIYDRYEAFSEKLDEDFHRYFMRVSSAYRAIYSEDEEAIEVELWDVLLLDGDNEEVLLTK